MGGVGLGVWGGVELEEGREFLPVIHPCSKMYLSETFYTMTW